MALYSFGLRTTGSSLAAAEIYTADDRVSLLEFSFMGVFNSNPEFGIGRPVLPGAGRGTGAFQPDNPSDPPCTAFITGTWASPPTSPLVFMRRGRLDNGANSVGRGLVWTWKTGLIIPPQSSIVFWHTNPAVITTWDINVVIEA